MLIFEYCQLYYTRKWRWLITLSIIFVFAFLVIEVQSQTNYWDFLFSTFMQFFFCLLLLPTLFLFLVSDLIIRDYEDGLMTLIISRINSKLNWLITKIVIIAVASFSFITAAALVVSLVSFIKGVKFQWSWSNIAIFPDHISPYIMGIIIFSIFWTTLTTIGTFSLFISVMTRNLTISWIICIVIIFLGFLFYKSLDLYYLFTWMPTAQLFFVAMYPNSYIDMVEGFSVQASYTYNIILFLISFSGLIFLSRGLTMVGDS